MRVDQTVRLGTDWDVGFSLTDPSTGDPTDIAGWTGTLRARDFSGNIIATTSLVIDNVLGVCHFTVPGASTLTWIYQNGDYDAVIHDAGGKIRVLQAGTLYMEQTDQ